MSDEPKRLVPIKHLCGSGQGRDQFEVRLADLAVDDQDRLHVLGDHHLKSFSPDGELVRDLNLGQLSWSVISHGDEIWIGSQHDISSYDEEGRRTQRIVDSDRLGRITGLVVGDDVVIAADAVHRAIRVYSHDGQWLRDIGTETNTRGFLLPNGSLDIAPGGKGKTFVVAHPGKHRVERYGMDGPLLAKFGRFGMQRAADFSGCCNPTTIGVTANGAILTAEKAPPRIKVYSPSGALLAMAGPDPFDPTTKNIALAADRRGRVYAGDPVTRKVHVFEPFEPARDSGNDSADTLTGATP